MWVETGTDNIQIKQVLYTGYKMVMRTMEKKNAEKRSDRKQQEGESVTEKVIFEQRHA